MSDINDIMPIAETVFDSIKRIFQLLKSKQYFAALKELFNLVKITYANHIKGRFVTIKGHQIPLAAVLAAAILFLYIIFPGGDEKSQDPSKPTISEAEMVAQSNYYNHDGIIVDKMHKCKDAVCGTLENTTDKEIAEVTIPVAFFNKEGILVYEGRIKANNVPTNEPKEFQISAEVSFDFFKLGVVMVEK